MNIFKVFASGKTGFQEVYASAIISWFLNPTMEHGLGFTFLLKFIEEIANHQSNTELRGLGKRLSSRLRTEYESQLKWSCYLEYPVDNAFIDVVLRVDDWIISVENKIFIDSASDVNQLVKQYTGLKKKHEGFRIGILFLVPIEDSSMLHPKIDEVFTRLNVHNNDFKTVVTWQKNDLENIPSIEAIIEDILKEESLGKVEPIPEYTRHTLKALNAFISSNFTGYDYERAVSSSGDNPLTENRCDVSELSNISVGYVGVANGVSGLMRMDNDDLKQYKFQYTTADMSAKRNWLPIDTFNNIVKWLLYGQVMDIEWDFTLHSKFLYEIAKDYKDKVYIGIKGGAEKLKQMTADEVRDKSWGISTIQNTSSWIDGITFSEIIELKNAF